MTEKEQKAWDLMVSFERTFVSDKPGRIKRRNAILAAIRGGK